MEAKSRQCDGKTIVDVSGELVMRTSAKLQKELKELVAKRTTPIIISFEEVSFMDSSGLATLVECLLETRKYSGDLRLYGVSTNIQHVFKVLKLDNIFSIYSSEKEALESDGKAATG